ncbi:MAG: NYN domain-containing protein [Kiritimatiellia bacterium]
MTRRTGSTRSEWASLIVDGYNVINCVPELRNLMSRSLDAARRLLLERCAGWLRTRRDVESMIVVFDGDAVDVPQQSRSVTNRRIKSIYTRNGESADDRIVVLVGRSGESRRCLVVTADRQLEARVVAMGAQTMLPLEFDERARKANVHSDPRRKEDEGRNLTAEQKEKINRELMEIWDE